MRTIMFTIAFIVVASFSFAKADYEFDTNFDDFGSISSVGYDYSDYRAYDFDAGGAEDYVGIDYGINSGFVSD